MSFLRQQIQQRGLSRGTLLRKCALIVGSYFFRLINFSRSLRVYYRMIVTLSRKALYVAPNGIKSCDNCVDAKNLAHDETAIGRALKFSKSLKRIYCCVFFQLRRFTSSSSFLKPNLLDVLEYKTSNTASRYQYLFFFTLQFRTRNWRILRACLSYVCSLLHGPRTYVSGRYVYSPTNWKNIFLQTFSIVSDFHIAGLELFQ